MTVSRVAVGKKIEKLAKNLIAAFVQTSATRQKKHLLPTARFINANVSELTKTVVLSNPMCVGLFVYLFIHYIIFKQEHIRYSSEGAYRNGNAAQLQ